MRNFFILLVFLLIPLTGLAQIEVSADLSANTIVLEEEATLTIKITGNVSVSEPAAPQVDGLDIVQTGRSSQIQIINGDMSTVANYIYTILASREGDYTIPPFVVYSQGVEYKTPSLTLHVKKGSASSKSPPFAPPSQIPDDAPFWISTTVNKTNPKIHEQILYRFKVYTRTRIEFVELKLPEFKDFRIEQVVPEKRGEETIGGQTYKTYETIYALFPLKSGPVQIEESLLKLNFYETRNRQRDPTQPFDPFSEDPFFKFSITQPKTTILKGDAIPLEVAELPEPIPHDFTNLIGKFGLQVSLDEKEIAVGEPATLTIHLAGEGNITEAVLPEFKILKVKTYDEKPKVDLLKSSQGLSGKKSFRLTLIPNRAGTIDLSTLSVSYYDTESDQYKQLPFPDFKLLATGEAKEKEPDLILAKDPLKTDIQWKGLAPIVSDWQVITKHSFLRMPQSFFWFLFWLGPVVFLAVTLMRYFSHVNQTSDRRFLKRAFAQLKGLEKRDVSGAQVFEKVQRYFGALTKTPWKAITTMDIQNFCARRNIPFNFISDLKNILETIEASQYGRETKTFDETLRKRCYKTLASVQKEMIKEPLKNLGTLGETRGRIIFFALIFFLIPFALKASLPDLYESAKTAYYEQDYQKARAIFEDLLRQEPDQPYLFYNLGNVFFQQGQIGEAIRYYEKASLDLPRFQDLKINLTLSREKLVDKIEVSFWEYLYNTFYFWIKWVSHNELQVFLIVVSLFFWGNLTALLSRGKSCWKIRHLLFTLFFVYLLAGYHISSELRGKPYGVVLPVEIQVRASYLDTEKTIFLLHEGTKVRLVDGQDFGEDRWLKIELPQGQKGWVKAKDIGKI